MKQTSSNQLAKQQIKWLLFGGLMLALSIFQSFHAWSGSARFFGLTAPLATGALIAVGIKVFGRRGVLARAHPDAIFVATGFLPRSTALILSHQPPGTRRIPEFAGDTEFRPDGFMWRPRRLARGAGVLEIEIPWSEVRGAEIDNLPAIGKLIAVALATRRLPDPIVVRMTGVSVNSAQEALESLGVALGDDRIGRTS